MVPTPCARVLGTCGAHALARVFMCLARMQAVEESERALAVVQARLLEALLAKAAQEAAAAAAKHTAEQERLRLEAEVGP